MNGNRNLHDPALCRRAFCRECDAYGDGYARDKELGRREVLQHIRSQRCNQAGCEVHALLARRGSRRVQAVVRRAWG